MLLNITVQNGVATSDGEALYNWASASPLHMFVACLAATALVILAILYHLSNKRENAIKDLAIKELKRDLGKGKEVFGWKYYKSHKGITGSCLYNGNLFIPLHRFWYNKDYGASDLMKEIEQVHTHYIARAQRFRTCQGKKPIKVPFSR